MSVVDDYHEAQSRSGKIEGIVQTELGRQRGSIGHDFIL
jgi:hypothetical protein